LQANISRTKSVIVADRYQCSVESDWFDIVLDFSHKIIRREIIRRKIYVYINVRVWTQSKMQTRFQPDVYVF